MRFGGYAGSSGKGLETPIPVGFHVPWNYRKNLARLLKQLPWRAFARRAVSCYLEDEESSAFAAGSSSPGPLPRRDEKKLFSLYQYSLPVTSAPTTAAIKPWTMRLPVPGSR